MKLGIISGQGQLPISVTISAISKGYDVYILRIKGLCDKSALNAYPGRDWNLGNIGGALQVLKEEGCQGVVFAGYVTRPDFADIDFDAKGQALLPKIIQAAAQGDDAVLKVFVSTFEAEGFKVFGAEDIYEDLLCPVGVLGAHNPSENDLTDLKKAMHIAGVIGREDIGQGCVVCDGVVLAVEAQEGTDAMIKRAGDLDLAYRPDTRNRKGVLVKRTKPEQERRVDLPVIGPLTVELLDEAGLAGIGLEAGGCLIVDKEKTIAAANQAGIFLMGLPYDEAG